MKKTNIYLSVFAIMASMFISCGDNDNFSKEHILTDNEIKELARQDSIREAQKNKINADLILEYTANVVVSANLYTGVDVEVEMSKIAQLFDITEEQLLAGIDEEAGAPEINGFAINWSDRKEIAGKSNTNAPWGHWWSAKGDVTGWGDDAMTFAEFNSETKSFHVGQFPGHLTIGQNIKFIECLKYNDKRAAVVIDLNAIDAPKVEASIVDIQEISVEVIPNNSYVQTPVQFDINKTFSDLGISSMDEVQFLGVKQDGSYSQETVTGKGFWYDKEGYVGDHGDNASVYTNYGEVGDDDCIGIGQMPDQMQPGMSVTIQYGFLANNKIVMLKITVIVNAYEDPEEKPAGEPTVIEENISMTKQYDNTYTPVNFDVKDILKDAFKMTTYEIFQAKNNGSLKIYINEESEEEPAYTADSPGYWIDEQGIPTEYGTGYIWCSLGGSETELYLYGGNHPSNCPTEGTTIQTKVIVLCNGGKAIFNLTYEITPGIDIE